MESPNCDWSNAIQSLKSLKQQALTYAEQELIWYSGARNEHGIISRVITTLSILLVAFGTLLPLANEVLLKKLNTSWGYLSLSLGGVFILFDKHFGISTGFKRFYIAELSLINLQNEFSVEWEIGMVKISENPSQENIIDLLNVVRSYYQKINKTINDETNAWAIEFNDMINDLQKKIDSNKASSNP